MRHASGIMSGTEIRTLPGDPLTTVHRHHHEAAEPDMPTPDHRRQNDDAWSRPMTAEPVPAETHPKLGHGRTHAPVQPDRDRAALAAAVGRRRPVRRLHRLGQAEVLRAGHVPLHLGRPAHRPLVQLRAGRRPRPLQAHARLQRPDADGLRRLRAARRERRHRPGHPSVHLDDGQHRAGWSARSRPWAACTTGRRRWPPACPSTTVEPVVLPEVLREGAWPTARRRRSTGARRTRACWPTSRSSTAAAGAAARRSIRRDLEQWFFRITDYADELLDFSEIEWPERVETMQRNWIGRSEGVEFDIPVEGQPTRRSPSSPPASTRSSA